MVEEIYRFIATVINEGGLTSVVIFYHSKQNFRIKAKFSACINIKDSVYEKNATDLGFF